MSLGRKTALLLAAIAVFTMGAIVAIWVATDPGSPGDAAAKAAAPAAPDAGPPGGAAPAPVLPAETGIAAPPEWRAQHPTVPVPVPNAAPPIDGPPPPGVPTDPAEREDAILRVRRSRFSDQMERLNRRTAERGGTPGDAGARPPASTPPPGSAASRRAPLSATN